MAQMPFDIQTQNHIDSAMFWLKKGESMLNSASEPTFLQEAIRCLEEATNQLMKAPAVQSQVQGRNARINNGLERD